MTTDRFSQGSFAQNKAHLFSLFAIGTVICCFCPAQVSAATITYVQGAYATPQTPQTTVSVTFTAAQAAGDLNVVVVGWSDSTATVSTITDKNGNTYTRAVGPTVQSGVASQSIYYAKNIAGAAAGANSVTVTFSSAAVYPDIRILEYKGADPNSPVDVTAASSGNSATSSSGAVTTTNATDLIFGANLVQTTTTGPASGFTKRLLTSPDGDIAEDKMVSATGSYGATAPLSSAPWIMQMVAFRTPTGSFTLSASPAAVSVAQANQATSTLTTTVSGGFSSAISLSASGMPTGTTTSFNPSAIAAPGSGTSTMTITVGASTTTGTYPITVTGTGGAVQQTATVTLTVTAGAGPNFTLSLSPTAVSVVQGNQGTSTLATAASGGFGSAVSLSASGMPTGTAVTFNPSSIAAPGSGTSMMTITVGASTTTGTYPITVTGNGGGIQHTTTLNLTVIAAPSFTLSVSPSAASVVQGNQGTSTLTTTVSGGFNSAISLSASGMPTGTAVSFNPSSIAAPGSGTSTMTITVGASTATGSYLITVTANGGGIQQTANFTLTVVNTKPTPTAPTNLSALNRGPGPVVTTVQSYINSTSLTSHTTAAFDSTGGDLIVMCASSHMGVTFTPSDNFGNTWIPIGGPTNTSAGFDLRTELWYVRSPIVGPGHTITMDLSIAQPLVISIFVVKGSNISSPIDAVSPIGSDDGTQSVSVASPSIATNVINDLLIGFVKVSADATFQAGTGFTQQTAASSNFLDAETGPAAAQGSYDATFTISAPQTWQSAVVAAANSPNQTTLSWTASTEAGGTISDYLVERCQGSGCTSFAQIGTTTATTFNDTGLSASASYSYRVRAEDTANTVGPYSSVVTIVTPAAIPSLPGNLTATATSSTQINLSWMASLETGGTVSNYLVERCQGVNCSTFAQIGTSVGISYSDTNLTPNTTYSYRVRSTDAVNSLSPYSNMVSATSASAGPIISYVQSAYTSPQTSQTSVSVTFPAAQTAGDLNVVAVGWNNSTAAVSTITDKSGNIYTLAVGPTIQSGVASQAIYYAKNILAAAAGANSVTVTFSSSAAYPDIRILEYTGADPNSPVDVTAANSGNSATSSSGAATTTNGPDLIFGANLVQTTTAGPGSGFTRRLLTSPDGDIAEDQMVPVIGSYTATAPLSSGQWIMQMVAFRTALGTVTPPTAPTNLTAAATSASQINLTWTASTSNIGIANYVVQRCQGAGCTNFAQIATPVGTNYSDIGVVSNTTYNYRVQAVDTAGNLSLFSNSASATAVTPPTAPSNLAAAANRQGPIDLTWTASTSGIGIADYLVQRCQGSGCTNFTQIATSTGTSYIDSSVSSTTTYTYRVEAVDTAGNLSAFSNTATVTTVGSQPPTAPGNLTATSVSASQIDLSWTASVSSIGLANYAVQRCQGVGCTNFAQIATPTGTTYIDTGLTTGSSYSYQVEAIDIEGNVSPFSNTATAIPSATTTITYVQGAYASPQSTQTSVSVTFAAAQAAGDLNVVAVGWNNSTATVSSITDKSGNAYTLAVGPTIQSGVASQSIYYAKSIVAAAAGTNVVTVTFSSAAAFPDIRILEYKGVDPNNPVDVTAASGGNSATSASGSATTTNATDLLFGANLVQTTTSGPGGGFTSRLLTSPDGDIAEDQMVTATGAYSATAPLSSGQWIMQMVAFRTPVTCSVGAPPTTPSNLIATAAGVNQINLNWTASTSCAGIAYYVVQRCQGANCTAFAQVGTPTSATFSDTALTGNTGYNYQVQAIDNNASSSPFSNVASATTLAISISPRTTALTFTRTQQFTSADGSTGVTWSVDGTAGGSASSGTITNTGLYTPPSVAGTHTVTVTTSDQLHSANATVFITSYPGTFTYHNDNLRTGQNLSETVLTLGNVNRNQFGKLFSYPIDGIAFASPLYVANVAIPGQGYHNVVYVATEHDSVYAFDADGLSTTPLWHVSFLSSGVTTVPCADTGECGDIPTEIGITSTPVIDQSSGTIYVVAATKEGASTWVQRLHALDITTGAEKFGGPVALQASVAGTGTGSSGGKVAFDSLRENQRPGLLLNSGVVYLAFGSHGDNTPWHGWVLGYNATTLTQTMQYNASPNGNGGGIWQGGGGLATDATGDIYFVTSNGDFDANTGGKDYGDSIVKLGTSGTVADYFAPHDQANMSANNLDLGAGGPVLLVDQTTGSFPHLLITAGKSGTIYVINRDNLGKYNASDDGQIVQSLPGVLPNGDAESGNFSTPVFFNGCVYFGAVNDTLKAFQLTNGQLSTGPTSQSAEVYGIRGGSFAISANTTSNGILWALQNNGASANNDVGNPGVLFAYDANNLSTELYNSSQAGNRDSLDSAVKFSVPLVANGKVFVAGQTQLTVFGLLP
jgi:fibronectin type 3 domain-containing protein